MPRTRLQPAAKKKKKELCLYSCYGSTRALKGAVPVQLLWQHTSLQSNDGHWHTVLKKGQRCKANGDAASVHRDIKAQDALAAGRHFWRKWKLLVLCCLHCLCSWCLGETFGQTYASCQLSTNFQASHCIVPGLIWKPSFLNSLMCHVLLTAAELGVHLLSIIRCRVFKLLHPR